MSVSDQDPDFPQVPDFADLPAIEGMPQGCAWNIFNQPNLTPTLGTLNFLTPSTIRHAYRELSTGTSISLNLPLDSLPLGFRRNLSHNPIHWQHDLQQAINSWDDELTFNTQASSQWDSLLHFAHQPSGKFYNGTVPSKEDLSASSGVYAESGREIPSLEKWHGRGGLVGRGVLVDFVGWARETGREFDALGRYVITVEELEEVVRWQGTELRRGDILVLRTGFVERMMELGTPEKMREAMGHGMAGVQGNLRTVEWFWNKRFAAVAADNIAFEVLPPEREDGSIASYDDLVLHPWFLSMFGLHIGELWLLKELAEHCAKLKRYSFLLTSIPLNVPGLVGSPPNALALF